MALLFQLGIPFEHLQCLVAGDRRHLHRVQPLLEEAAGRFVPEIMEYQINQIAGISLFPFLFAFLLVDCPGPGDGLAKYMVRVESQEEFYLFKSAWHNNSNGF